MMMGCRDQGHTVVRSLLSFFWLSCFPPVVIVAAARAVAVALLLVVYWASLLTCDSAR